MIFSGWQWSHILDDSELIMQILTGDRPVTDCPGRSGGLVRSLGRALKAATALFQDDLDQAEHHLASRGRDRVSCCEQLVGFWLLAETEEPEQVYQQLQAWQEKQEKEQKRLTRRLFPSLPDIRDRRLCRRWLPVLRYYLAAEQSRWTEAIEQQASADFDQARRSGISEVLLSQLRFLWRFSEARQSGSLGRLKATAESWYDLVQEHPRFQMGQAYLLEMAITLEQAGHSEEALVWVRRGLLKNPLQYEFILTEARISKRLGQNENSLVACDRLIEHYQDDYAGYCLRSNVYFLLGYYDQARQDADRAIQLAPDNPNSYMARGFVNLQLGHYQWALDDFNQVLQRDSQRYDALRGQGKCLSLLGRDYEALASFQSMLRQYPDDPDLYYEMADILFAAGYLEDCERICHRCLEVDDSYVSAYVILGMIALRRQEESKARDLLLKAVEMEPDNPFALNELSYLLHLEGEDDQAIALVDRAIAESPDYADALCNKGLILYYRSEFDQARDVFDQAIDLMPEHIPAWVGKGNTLTQLCEFDDALDCYDHALILDPNNAEACHGKALLYRMLGLDDEVRKWQERARRLDPTLEDD